MYSEIFLEDSKKRKWNILHFCNFENIMKSSFIEKFYECIKYYKLELRKFVWLRKNKNKLQAINWRPHCSISNSNFLKINVKLFTDNNSRSYILKSCWLVRNPTMYILDIAIIIFILFSRMRYLKHLLVLKYIKKQFN